MICSLDKQEDYYRRLHCDYVLQRSIPEAILLTLEAAVSILGRMIEGFTHFFQRLHIFFRPMCDIPALKLNDVNLLLEGKRLPSLKSRMANTQFTDNH